MALFLPACVKLRVRARINSPGTELTTSLAFPIPDSKDRDTAIRTLAAGNPVSITTYYLDYVLVKRSRPRKMERYCLWKQ